MEKELIPKETLLKFDPKTSFTILSKGHVVNVHFSEVTHVSKNGNETIIHTVTQRWHTYHSLQEILNDLPLTISSVLIVSRPKNIVSQFSAEILSQQGF